MTVPGGYYLYIHGRLEGPCTAADLLGNFGGVSPETLVCPEFEFLCGRPQWRKVTLFPELAACVKSEIAEPIPDLRPAVIRKKRLSILSTDDDPNIRTLLWSLLEEAGHEVEFARDGEEVFKRLGVKRYDLLILDVNMPGMNGYQVSELLHDKLQDPPKVIIFTGRNVENEKVQFICCGADAILNKGTGNDKLLSVIDSLFLPAPQPSAAPLPPAQPAEPLTAAGPQPAPEPEPPARLSELPAPVAVTPGQDALERLAREKDRLRSDLVSFSDRLVRLELAHARLERQVLSQAARAAQAERAPQSWRFMLPAGAKRVCAIAALLLSSLIALAVIR